MAMYRLDKTIEFSNMNVDQVAKKLMDIFKTFLRRDIWYGHGIGLKQVGHEPVTHDKVGYKRGRHIKQVGYVKEVGHIKPRGHIKQEGYQHNVWYGHETVKHEKVRYKRGGHIKLV